MGKVGRLLMQGDRRGAVVRTTFGVEGDESLIDSIGNRGEGSVIELGGLRDRVREFHRDGIAMEVVVQNGE